MTLTLVPALRTDPVLGWRCWRVLPYRGTDDEKEHRLCAVGRLGRPKEWEPRQPVQAVCSAFDSRHAAPSFRHECGLWALNDRDEALRRLAELVETQGGLVSGWAFGQVSLWGKLIEHETGWRAQYAYPFAIKVMTPERRIADAIARAYGVEVEWDPVSSTMLHAAERVRRSRDELNEIIRELGGLRRQLEHGTAQARAHDLLAQRLTREMARPAATSAGKSPPDATESKPLPPPLPQVDYDDDDLLAGLLAAVAFAIDHQKGWSHREVAAQAMNVTEALLWNRGLTGANVDARPGYKSLHANVVRRLRALATAGLAESGIYKGGCGQRYWRLTAKGRERLLAADLPEHFHAWHRTGWSGGEGVQIALKTARVLAAAAEPPELFAHEIEALQPTWIAERRAAQARGRKAYRDWLRRWRLESGDLNRLPLEDVEILVTIAALAKRRRGPVLASAVLAVLVPGKPTHSEVGQLSQALVRLRKAGSITHDGGTPKLWQPA